MCWCTPSIRMPHCGKPGCTRPEYSPTNIASGIMYIADKYDGRMVPNVSSEISEHLNRMAKELKWWHDHLAQTNKKDGE